MAKKKTNITERSCQKWEVFSFLLLFEMARREVKQDKSKNLYKTFDEKLSWRLGINTPFNKGPKAA